MQRAFCKSDAVESSDEDRFFGVASSRANS